MIIFVYQNQPDLPVLVTCYSVIIFTVDDKDLWILSFVALSYLLLLLSVTLNFLFYVTSYSKQTVVISRSAKNMQNMFIFSLTIQITLQTVIHTIMILVPSFFFVYTLFFYFNSDVLGMLLIMSVACHGFFSTVAMIMFTKPIRKRFLQVSHI
nr:hypothetical protein E03H12.8 - Caenorhabditis elegans [Caenorhabditis elegans]